MAPALGVGVPLLIRNTGSSMPRGFYVWSHAAPAAKGEVIVVREPEHFRWSWLMKRVVGTAGDRFCWRPEIGTHFVGVRRMPPPSPDALELGLQPWQGCRVLAPGESRRLRSQPRQLRQPLSGADQRDRSSGGFTVRFGRTEYGRHLRLARDHWFA